MLDANATDDLFYGQIYPYNYGKIIALPGVYWTRDVSITGPGFRTVTRCRDPHLIDQDGAYPDPNQVYQSANTMTLCSSAPHEFHEHGENTIRYWIDLGGIYKVYSPLINSIPPLYVYVPPFYGLTYVGAPDMNVLFGGTDEMNTCGNGNNQFSPSHEIYNCIPGYFTDDLIGLSNPYGYYVTEDYSAMSNYWMDNAIIVGLTGTMGGGAMLNTAEFYADNTASTCNPLSLPDVGNLIGTLECVAGSTFEVMDTLSTQVSIGDSVIVHVQATYANGETINQCQYIVINSNILYGGAVCAAIRGDISDYSTSPINYRINIYETTP